MRNIIKYVGIVLVIAGILLVMKNLFAQDDSFSNPKKNKIETPKYYSAEISLLDKENDAYLSGISLVLKNEKNETIEKWTSDDGVHLVSNLQKGKYTVEQENTLDGYKEKEEVTTFEITDKDTEVIVYNEKLTEEEIEELRQQNTTSNEVGVENTLSVKNIWSILGGVVSIVIGVGMILFQKKSSSNDV